MRSPPLSFLFFFNDTATTEIYTLSLHDALPISHLLYIGAHCISLVGSYSYSTQSSFPQPDRKSTRLNSSHQIISYAVFCLKKKNNFPFLLSSSPPRRGPPHAHAHTRAAAPRQPT